MIGLVTLMINNKLQIQNIPKIGIRNANVLQHRILELKVFVRAKENDVMLIAETLYCLNSIKTPSYNINDTNNISD